MLHSDACEKIVFRNHASVLDLVKLWGMAAYDFLTGGLDSFRQYGEVYLSDRLQSRRIQPTAASVGRSVSDGLLTLTLDTGGFPKEELSACEALRCVLLRLHLGNNSIPSLDLPYCAIEFSLA